MISSSGPARPAPGSIAATTDRVWYAAYGSNLRGDRLRCYLAGGTPPGGARTYPGCRDTRPPERALPLLLPGQLYFALESATWTGGVAFYDPLDPGEIPARAYLLTAAQFSDVAAQEMYRDPGADLDLSTVLGTGRATLGPGRYETLVCPGLLDGHPVLTFTAPWRSAEADLNKPAAAYLRTVATGLRESHGWATGQVAGYLADRPGARGAWTAGAIRALVADGIG